MDPLPIKVNRNPFTRFTGVRVEFLVLDMKTENIYILGSGGGYHFNCHKLYTKHSVININTYPNNIKTLAQGVSESWKNARERKAGLSLFLSFTC